MARFKVDAPHFKSSYRSPYLLEPGEVLNLPLGEWPSTTWTPLDADAKARQAAQAGYTRILEECRTPVGVTEAPALHHASERPATLAAQFGRRLIMKAVLEALPKDASTAPALAWLAQPEKAIVGRRPLSDDLKAIATEMAEDLAKAYVEDGSLPTSTLGADEELESEGPRDVVDAYDPMTDRRQPRPEDGPRIGVQPPETSETWDEAAEAQARAHAEAQAPARRPRAARRAADQEI